MFYVNYFTIGSIVNRNRVHCADSDSRIVNLSALLNVLINFHLKKYSSSRKKIEKIVFSTKLTNNLQSHIISYNH